MPTLNAFALTFVPDHLGHKIRRPPLAAVCRDTNPGLLVGFDI
jgi:hypothetical protein